MSQQDLPCTPPPQMIEGGLIFFRIGVDLVLPIIFFYWNLIFTNFPLNDTHLSYTIQKVSSRSIFFSVISNKTILNWCW